MTTTLKQALVDALIEAREGNLAIGDVADLIADVIGSWRAQDTATEGADVLTVEAGVSAFTGDPFVLARVGKESWQWTPADARTHAAGVVHVAEAAVHDAAMVRWMTLGPMELSQQMAIAALLDLRRYRGDSTA